MRISFFHLHVELLVPDNLADLFRDFFRLTECPAAEADTVARVSERPGEGYEVFIDDGTCGLAPDAAIAMQKLLVGLRKRAAATDPGQLLRASAVGWGDRSILIVGDVTDAGDVAAWLVGRGFSYLSQGFVRIAAAPDLIEGAAGPMAIGRRGIEELGALEPLRERPSLGMPSGILVQPDPGWAAFENPSRCALVLHIRRLKEGALQISEGDADALPSRLAWLSGQDAAADAARDRAAGALAASVPVLAMTYTSLLAGNDTVDTLLRLIVEEAMTKARVGALLRVMRPSAPAADPQAMPPATRRSRSAKPRLTIGMATYDDFDGVYFSVQALRMYHPEVADQAEIIVIDNNPAGVSARFLKDLDLKIENYRYIPETGRVGSAVRDRIFAEAEGDIVLCMDCHVLFERGSIAALLDFFERNPETNDLIQGPIVWDNLTEWSAYWEPVWSSGMFGLWAANPAADDPRGPAFEIPMQGLGVFACRRAAWPGFHPQFRGFGGEEGYIHEKFRKRGDRVLCLPGLRWLHRFSRPMGVRYPINWEDRIRNYLLGRRELGIPEDDVLAHMRDYLGADYVNALLSSSGLALAEQTGE